MAAGEASGAPHARRASVLPLTDQLQVWVEQASYWLGQFVVMQEVQSLLVVLEHLLLQLFW